MARFSEAAKSRYCTVVGDRVAVANERSLFHVLEVTSGKAVRAVQLTDWARSYCAIGSCCFYGQARLFRVAAATTATWSSGRSALGFETCRLDAHTAHGASKVSTEPLSVRGDSHRSGWPVLCSVTDSANVAGNG